MHSFDDDLWMYIATQQHIHETQINFLLFYLNENNNGTHWSHIGFGGYTSTARQKQIQKSTKGALRFYRWSQTDIKIDIRTISRKYQYPHKIDICSNKISINYYVLMCKKTIKIDFVQKNNEPPWLPRKKNNFILHEIFGTNLKSKNTKNNCKQNIFDRKVIDINNGIKNNYVNLGESSTERCLKSFFLYKRWQFLDATSALTKAWNQIVDAPNRRLCLSECQDSFIR